MLSEPTQFAINPFGPLCFQLMIQEQSFLKTRRYHPGVGRGWWWVARGGKTNYEGDYEVGDSRGLDT